MKTVVVAAALLTLCSGEVVPKDNSHYVEGESRYVWMSDAEGSRVLVDLKEPVDEELLKTRNGANNQYFLFTRRNTHSPQRIEHGNWSSVLNSNYDSTLNLNVIVHGWNQNGDTTPNPRITSALLSRQDCNVIVVDWHALANSNYTTAHSGVLTVGQYLGIFLLWLMNMTLGEWNQVHLIGFDLGAHVVAVAGRHTGSRPARITGLDPAGANWVLNANRLSPNSGQYVEAIHTDGDGLGIFIPSGHADFYVNGARHPQPGCTLFGYICSHNFAIEMFALSIRDDVIGRECSDPFPSFANCNGGELLMGNGDVDKRGSGIYHVIERWWPAKTVDNNLGIKK